MFLHTTPSSLPPALRQALWEHLALQTRCCCSVIPQDPVDFVNTVVSSCVQLLCVHLTRKHVAKKTLTIQFVYLRPSHRVKWSHNLSSNPQPYLHLQAHQILYSLQTHHTHHFGLPSVPQTLQPPFQTQGLHTSHSLCLRLSSSALHPRLTLFTPCSSHHFPSPSLGGPCCPFLFQIMLHCLQVIVAISNDLSIVSVSPCQCRTWVSSVLLKTVG